MQGVLTEIINLLVGGISGIASSIGQGLQQLVTAIFLTGEGTQASPYALSVYGAIIIVFASVALAVSLSRFIVNWLSSLGN